MQVVQDMTPDMTPLEAIDFTEKVLKEGTLASIPPDAAPFLAALLLVLIEIGNGDCQCTGCCNIREVLNNA